MQDLYHQQYLSTFAEAGINRCRCGLEHRMLTRRVLFGRGAIDQLPALVRERLGARARLWVLSDGNTEQAAGAAVKRVLGEFPLADCLLPASPRPRTTYPLAERLAEELRQSRADLILAVGGGTVSDLGKKVSTDTGIPNWCVATAASVDAYGSGTSNMKLKGFDRTVPVTPSEVVVCDLEVLGAAPVWLFLSGLGDLLAKFLGYLDWKLAAWVTGEYFCPVAAEYSLQSARRALQAARSLQQDREEAVRTLVDALLTSSFAMQAIKGSRPAATAEHTVGHLWELSGRIRDPRYDLHGICVGAASRLVLAAYLELYKALPRLEVDIPARLEALRREPPWQETLEPSALYLKEKMLAETPPGYPDPAEVRGHLEAFARQRQPLQALAAQLLAELQPGLQALAEAGFPFSLKEYGLDEDAAFLPFPYIRYLRRRYSGFNLMHELGLEGEILRRLKASLAALWGA